MLRFTNRMIFSLMQNRRRYGTLVIAACAATLFLIRAGGGFVPRFATGGAPRGAGNAASPCASDGRSAERRGVIYSLPGRLSLDVESLPPVAASPPCPFLVTRTLVLLLGSRRFAEFPPRLGGRNVLERRWRCCSNPVSLESAFFWGIDVESIFEGHTAPGAFSSVELAVGGRRGGLLGVPADTSRLRAALWLRAGTLERWKGRLPILERVAVSEGGTDEMVAEALVWLNSPGPGGRTRRVALVEEPSSGEGAGRGEGAAGCGDEAPPWYVPLGDFVSSGGLLVAMEVPWLDGRASGEGCGAEGTERGGREAGVAMYGAWVMEGGGGPTWRLCDVVRTLSYAWGLKRARGDVGVADTSVWVPMYESERREFFKESAAQARRRRRMLLRLLASRWKLRPIRAEALPCAPDSTAGSGVRSRRGNAGAAHSAQGGSLRARPRDGRGGLSPGGWIVIVCWCFLLACLGMLCLALTPGPLSRLLPVSLLPLAAAALPWPPPPWGAALSTIPVWLVSGLLCTEARELDLLAAASAAFCSAAAVRFEAVRGVAGQWHSCGTLFAAGACMTLLALLLALLVRIRRSGAGSSSVRSCD